MTSKKNYISKNEDSADQHIYWFDGLGAMNMKETCGICGCSVHHNGAYGKSSTEGRSHATKHHYIAERFFGRSRNRPGTTRKGIFKTPPWELNSEAAVFCYECHEELLHNPVFLPKDVAGFAELVRVRGFGEVKKNSSREMIAGRVKLLHEVISAGLGALLGERPSNKPLKLSVGRRRPPAP